MQSNIRIGVLTFQRVYNYGATLQAYALEASFEKLGAEVSILDYRNPTLEVASRLIKPGEHISLNSFSKLVFRVLKHYSFDAFDRKMIHLTQKIDNYTAFVRVVNSFSALVVGSDQVWNDEITGGDATFYLDFPGTDVKHYAYAASFAGSSVRAKQIIDNHAAQLNSFNMVSLRESDGIKYFKDVLKCKVRQDIDPVLLLTRSEWEDVVGKRPYASPYLFMYLVADEDHIRCFAESYARKHSLVLIDNKRSVKFLKHCSPEDFLSWIANADTVITNSFHGTAFSIIFQKNAYYELRQGKLRNYRAAALLTALNIERREILGDEAPDSNIPIDWTSVEARLSMLREDSLAYLRHIVGECNE